jgi:hypothetical protein
MSNLTVKNSLKFVLLGWDGQQAALLLLYSTFEGKKEPCDE